MWLVPLAIVVVIVGFVASRQARDAASRSAAIGAGLALGVVLLLASTVTIIPAGHVGIVDLFGRVSDVGLQPGVRLVIPLARVHKMSIRTREVTEAAGPPPLAARGAVR